MRLPAASGWSRHPMTYRCPHQQPYSLSTRSSTVSATSSGTQGYTAAFTLKMKTPAEITKRTVWRAPGFGRDTVGSYHAIVELVVHKTPARGVPPHRSQYQPGDGQAGGVDHHR